MKGYKTILVGIAATVLGVLEQLDITTIIPDQFDDLAVAVLGVVMVALRMVTTGPVGKK